MDKLERLEARVAMLEQENAQLREKQVETNQAKELYLKFFEDFPALIWRANLDKLCDYFNSTWLDFTGRTLEQEYGNGWTEGVHPDDLDRCVEIYVTAFDKREPFSMEYRLRHKSGEYRWIRDNGQPYYDLDDEFLGYIGSCYDITESHLYEERLKQLSITDPLTKIFNRLKLDETLKTEIRRVQRFGQSLSVILLDIDLFKRINDSFGHETGDSVLIELSKILQANIRETDTLGRWGGEEFLVICPQTDASGTITLAEKLRSAIRDHNFSVGEPITASFGVSTYSYEDTQGGLITRADKALYLAKANGRNTVEVV